MDETRDTIHHSEQAEIERQVAAKEERKLKAQSEKNHSIWFGLGMMGLIGWSVAVPALIGVAIGLWIDSHWPSPYSCGLMFLILGIGIGCLNAWNWLQKEGRSEARRESRSERQVPSETPSSGHEAGGDRGK